MQNVANEVIVANRQIMKIVANRRIMEIVSMENVANKANIFGKTFPTRQIIGKLLPTPQGKTLEKRQIIDVSNKQKAKRCKQLEKRQIFLENVSNQTNKWKIVANVANKANIFGKRFQPRYDVKVDTSSGLP